MFGLDLTTEKLRFAVLAVIIMVLSSAVHEWAHAFTAVKLGDDTPRRQGRLTLNPMAHIDPIGTLLMPAIGALYGFLFGYAKPVQFVPYKLTRKISMQRGILLVALAGPVSNLILAFICGALLKILTLTPYAVGEVGVMLGTLLYTGIWFNIVLFIFNFLPVYPLDGSKILEGVLPRRYHHFLEVLRKHSMLVMVFVFFVAIRWLTGPIHALLSVVVDLFGLSVGPYSPF